MVITMNIDKFDLFYGLSDKTKEKAIYWVVSFCLSFSILFINRSEDTFLHLKMSSSFKGIALFGLTIFFLGLIAYSFILGVVIVTDIFMFKDKQKKNFINKPVLSFEQKDKVLKKIRARKELYAVIIKPQSLPYRLTDKQWRYYTSKIGNRAEIASKAKFLLWVEGKVKTDNHLNDDEILFLNELLFSSDDLKLLSRIHKEAKTSLLRK